MSILLRKKSLYYNDVNLIADKLCTVSSRTEIPKELNRIIVSPMSSIVGKTFASKALELGLSITLHKFCEIEEQVSLYNYLININSEYEDRIFVSVGIKDHSRINNLLINNLLKNNITNILIDCANGYMRNSIMDTINFIFNKINEYKISKLPNIIIGNIMNEEGLKLYEEEWAHNLIGYKINNLYMRVGIGGGSACATKDVTGYNRGQVTELMEISNYNEMNNLKFKIIADGGIKDSGYAAKAFGAGADYLFMGGYFSRAFEAETNLKGENTYYGSSTTMQQKLYSNKGLRHSEGKILKIENIVPLEGIS